MKQYHLKTKYGQLIQYIYALDDNHAAGQLTEDEFRYVQSGQYELFEIRQVNFDIFDSQPAK